MLNWAENSLPGAGDLTFLVLFLGEKNFVSCMRETLQSHYGDKELTGSTVFDHTHYYLLLDSTQ